MSHKKSYVIGTRGSLLAVTQSTQIKRKLEALTGDHFELKLIETSGDQIADVPLWQIGGKDFFTRELDRALLAHEIDLVIHSYKDLGSDRPSDIELAAITKRYHSQDILFIKKEVASNLKNLNKIVVGTSAPRRTVNLKSHLKEVLPGCLDKDLEIKVLRGNINSRLKKLQKGDYDAIILALAGVERLCEEALINPNTAVELNEIFEGLTFSILSQTLFPSAAAQGALAIECHKNRADNGELLEKIKRLNDEITIDEVKRERLAFNSYGGGCHLAVGIHVKKCGNDFAHIHRGEKDGKVEKLFLERSKPLPKVPTGNIFVGLPEKKKDQIPFSGALYDSLLLKKEIAHELPPFSGHVLAAVDYGFSQVKIDSENCVLWCAGVTTQKKLAHKGFWCHGTLDLVGEVGLKDLINSPLIKFLFPKLKFEYKLLTHKDSKAVYPEGTVIPTYERQIDESALTHLTKEISKVDLFYWTSFSQYQTYLKYFPEIKNKTHCCGLGKTYQQFLDNNILAHPFIAMSEFYEWVSPKV